MEVSKSRPAGIYILTGLLFFQGISGMFGGGLLMWAPSGVLLQLPSDLLEPSPFSDYRIPGAILSIVLGVFPLVVGYGVIRRYRWSWLGAVIVSVALIIWIVVEIIMIGYQPSPPLQLIYGTIGVAMLMVTLFPSQRKFLNPSNQQYYD